MAASSSSSRRRRPSSAAAHFFEDELAEHRKRQEAKDRHFQEMLAALQLESAARNHSVQVGRCRFFGLWQKADDGIEDFHGRLVQNVPMQSVCNAIPANLFDCNKVAMK